MTKRFALAVLAAFLPEAVSATEFGHVIVGYGAAEFSSSDRFDAYYANRSQSFLLAYEQTFTWRLAVTVEIAYSALSFNENGFYEWEDVSRAVPVDGDAAKVSWSSVGLRFYPVALGAVRPHLTAMLSAGLVKEKYRYSDIEPGPIFPSGTYISRDATSTMRGFALKAGVRLETAVPVDPFGEVGFIWFRGDDVDLDVFAFWFGLAIGFD